MKNHIDEYEDNVNENIVSIDDINPDTISEDYIIEGLNDEESIILNYIKALFDKEYRDSYAEKANKTICALLNSGGGQCTIKISIADVVKHLHKEITKRFPTFQDNRLLNVEWKELIESQFSLAFDNDNIIHRELQKRLWAISIDEDSENYDSTLIESIVNDVITNGFNYALKRDGKNLGLVLKVEKPNSAEVYYCLKKRSRKGDFREKDLDPNLGKEFLFEFYFFVGDKVEKTDEYHLRYYKILSNNPELPKIKDYEPADYNSRKEQVEIKEKNNVDFEVIGEINSNSLYKYMDLESALRCLEKIVIGGKVKKNPNLRFVEPTSWDDQYEGRFYNACYKQDDSNGNSVDVEPKDAPFLYACCFSLKRENEAAWVLYSHNRTGLASRCVEFKLNRVKLREQLVKNLKDCSVYIGSVHYFNKEKIDHVHEKVIGKNNQPNEDYDKYFRPFTKECYLNLLLMKRAVFEHEKEVRIFIVPNDEIGNEKTRRGKDGKFPEHVKPKSKFVNIDWVEVIEEIKIDINCTEYEIGLLQNSLNKLLRLKKKEKGLGEKAYDKLVSDFQLKPFNPYQDDLLADGPLTIVTNQK